MSNSPIDRLPLGHSQGSCHVALYITIHSTRLGGLMNRKRKKLARRLPATTQIMHPIPFAHEADTS